MLPESHGLKKNTITTWKNTTFSTISSHHTRFSRLLLHLDWRLLAQTHLNFDGPDDPRVPSRAVRPRTSDVGRRTAATVPGPCRDRARLREGPSEALVGPDKALERPKGPGTIGFGEGLGPTAPPRSSEGPGAPEGNKQTHTHTTQYA